MLHPVLAEAFDDLLMTRRLCDDLAKSNAPYHRRLAAHFKLDEARNKLNRYRRRLNPEQRELEEVAVTAHCPSLGATVFVSHFDLARHGTGSTYPCVCGPEASLLTGVRRADQLRMP